jgi:hypothetical protein
MPVLPLMTLAMQRSLSSSGQTFNSQSATSKLASVAPELTPFDLYSRAKRIIEQTAQGPVEEEPPLSRSSAERARLLFHGNADRLPEEQAQVERVRLTMERGSQPRPRRSRRVRGLFSVSRRGGGQSPLRPRQRESTMPKPIVITLCSLAAGCIVAFAAAAFVSHL